VLTLDRLATAVFLGLAACTAGGGETGDETGETATSAYEAAGASEAGEGKAMGTQATRDPGATSRIAEIVTRVREETRAVYSGERVTQGEVAKPIELPGSEIGDVVYPVMMGGPKMGEPMPTMGVPMQREATMGRPAVRKVEVGR